MLPEQALLTLAFLPEIVKLLMTERISPRTDSVLTDKRHFKPLIVNTLVLQDAVLWEIISIFGGPVEQTGKLAH